MRIGVRADSGREIGTGHIMRCLTLADALKQKKHELVFFSRPHQGHTLEIVRQKGFELIELKLHNTDDYEKKYTHSSWLGCSEETDALECLQSGGRQCEMFIVDHYGIGSIGEELLAQNKTTILCIDDLADRQHVCHFLLDQTYGRDERDYRHLVAPETRLMLGAEHALLREEFCKHNKNILELRPGFKGREDVRILVMMGGTDHLNLSADVVNELLTTTPEVNITVLLGGGAAHAEHLSELCRSYDNVNLIIGAHNVADILLQHDICIGAAGASSWERCALGLPSLLFVFAKNQTNIARNLESAGAIKQLNYPINTGQITENLNALSQGETYRNMVKACLKVCDGKGVERVVKKVLNERY